MATPKFSRGQSIIVPFQDSKPELFAGHGTVTNVFRTGRKWSYEVLFDGGRKEEVAEARIERKGAKL